MSVSSGPVMPPLAIVLASARALAWVSAVMDPMARSSRSSTTADDGGARGEDKKGN